MFLLSIVISRKCGAADVIVCQRENYTYSSIQRSFNNIGLILIIIANINPTFLWDWRQRIPSPSLFSPPLVEPTRTSSCKKKLLGRIFQKAPRASASLLLLMSYFSFFVKHLLSVMKLVQTESEQNKEVVVQANPGEKNWGAEMFISDPF